MKELYILFLNTCLEQQWRYSLRSHSLLWLSEREIKYCFYFDGVICSTGRAARTSVQCSEANTKETVKIGRELLKSLLISFLSGDRKSQSRAIFIFLVIIM